MSNQTHAALKFITCGSVDDGKSTLIGRLLLDSKSVLRDQLSSVSKSGSVDLAQFTDGLSAEREQGITIDVAYRYFNTAKRKFIIGDTPGHEQYTRNMVTAASAADAAVVIIDATKLDYKNPELELLVQTRRHTLLCRMLRVHSLVFAVNKLDAVHEMAELAFNNIRNAVMKFTTSASISNFEIIPISALKGYNVVDEQDHWCGYEGPSLLEILEGLPNTPNDNIGAFSMPVQSVEKTSSSAAFTDKSRRILWGRVANGDLHNGQDITILPSGQRATVVQVLSAVRENSPGNNAGKTAGVVLSHEIDVSRGDWIVSHHFDSNNPLQRVVKATVAWLDVEPLVVGRTYWALHGHRCVKTKVTNIIHRLDISSLEESEASALPVNSIGHVEFLMQEPLVTMPFSASRTMGSFVLVDTATHRTAGAVII